MDGSEGIRYGRREDGFAGDVTRRPQVGFLRELDEQIAELGGEVAPEPFRDGAIGVTMFDVPSSQDGAVTVLIPQEKLQQAPSQSLVRIVSKDDRCYLGIVTAGPFAEPDSLKG